MTLKLDPAEIERILREEQARAQRPAPSPAPQPPQQAYVAGVANLQDYVFLAGRTHGTYSYPDSLVSKQTSFKNKDWFEAHQALQAEQRQMLTPRQFVDFLHLLMFEKASDGAGTALPPAEQKQLLDEIIAVRDPWRAEWLDADFKVVNGELRINYAHELISGQLRPRYSEKLVDCLIENRQIDLPAWLKGANQWGLPRQGIAKGSLYYRFPLSDNNSVARFGTVAGGVGLYCGRSPRGSGASLGVRRVAPIGAKI
ncbi:MAG: hypothetical protein HY438_00060 [DPANN group archaeon]|nr:hypothetical protein [DPANN group archaeon]